MSHRVNMATANIKAWLKRKRDAHKPEPSADEMWERINRRYGRMNEAAREAIFQGSN